MARGLHAAGFRPTLFYEKDPVAWTTLKESPLSPEPPPEWEKHRGDVRMVDWAEINQPVRLLAGGVPCQPFSLGGNHFADRDPRDMFPETTEAIRILQPRAVFLENVFGLLRDAFRPYFDYILLRLACPSLRPKSNEQWQDHDRRLRKHTEAPGYEPEYVVRWRCFDAADFGVPQNRKRVFIVGTRQGERQYEFPEPTHSRDELKLAQLDGGYWEKRGLSRPRTFPWRGHPRETSGERLPWVTAFDAIADLPTPAKTADRSEFNHWSVPGARSYPGHTGSHPHWPSKAIKAGVHGVPGGENTLRLSKNGEVRYYTLREMARIQTFPDDHIFHGARLHVNRQIGNAVPCRLAEQLARPLLSLLS